MSFIDQYVRDVIDDMYCMSSGELSDAVHKIENYVPLYEGTKRGEVFSKVINKLRSLMPTANKCAKSYFSVRSHYDDRWSDETRLES